MHIMSYNMKNRSNNKRGIQYLRNRYYYIVSWAKLMYLGKPIPSSQQGSLFSIVVALYTLLLGSCFSCTESPPWSSTASPLWTYILRRCTWRLSLCLLRSVVLSHWNLESQHTDTLVRCSFHPLKLSTDNITLQKRRKDSNLGHWIHIGTSLQDEPPFGRNIKT